MTLGALLSSPVGARTSSSNTTRSPEMNQQAISILKDGLVIAISGGTSFDTTGSKTSKGRVCLPWVTTTWGRARLVWKSTGTYFGHVHLASWDGETGLLGHGQGTVRQTGRFTTIHSSTLLIRAEAVARKSTYQMEPGTISVTIFGLTTPALIMYSAADTSLDTIPTIVQRSRLKISGPAIRRA